MKISEVIRNLIKAGYEERRVKYHYICSEGMCLVGAMVHHLDGRQPSSGSPRRNYRSILDRVSEVPPDAVESFIEDFQNEPGCTPSALQGVWDALDPEDGPEYRILCLLEFLNDTGESWESTAERLENYNL